MQLFITGLPSDLYEGEPKELFEEFGIVTSAKVIRDRVTHQIRGFGFVDMQDDGAAKIAL